MYVNTRRTIWWPIEQETPRQAPHCNLWLPIELAEPKLKQQSNPPAGETGNGKTTPDIHAHHWTGDAGSNSIDQRGRDKESVDVFSSACSWNSSIVGCEMDLRMQAITLSTSSLRYR